MLIRNDALRRRQTDASTGTVASFPCDIQTRLLSAGHLVSLPLQIRSHLSRVVKRVHQRAGLRATDPVVVKVARVRQRERKSFDLSIYRRTTRKAPRSETEHGAPSKALVWAPRPESG